MLDKCSCICYNVIKDKERGNEHEKMGKRNGS